MATKPVVVREADLPLETWDDPVRGTVSWRTLFSGDRTPTAGLTMGVAEVRPEDAGRTTLHRHAHPETYFILSGRGVLRINGEDHDLSPGAAAFIPGGALHGAHAVGDEPLRILYAFAADSFDEVRYEFPAAG